MSETAKTALTLLQLPRIKRGKVRDVLIKAASSGSDGLTVSNALDCLQLPEHRASTIDAAIAAADQILRSCQADGIGLHAYASSSYPVMLNRLAHPPVVLFSLGHFVPELKPRIAVIGTRTPTAWGTKTAKQCAGQVVALEAIVVSGLALGVDTAAHQAALDRAGVTWAVLPHGVRAPAATAAQQALAKRILDTGGALLSEYPPFESAQRRYFVERDRIQAGLVDAVLLIESELDGGAMHTVRFARQANIPVWVTLPRMKEACVDPSGLPAAQQGPWKLLHERAATRVDSAGVLANLIRDAD